jgi:predicted transcriptional regulator
MGSDVKFPEDAVSLEFVRAVVAGLADVEAGRVVPLAEVKRCLGVD